MTCKRCNGKAVKGSVHCKRHYELLKEYARRHARNKRLDAAFERQVTEVAAVAHRLGYNVSAFETDVRKLAAALGVR